MMPFGWTGPSHSKVSSAASSSARGFSRRHTNRKCCCM